MTPPLALWVWYRGECFRGFQAQVLGPTVQDSLGRALMAIGVRAHPVGAARTDKGVHARMQVLSLRAGHLDPGDLLRKLESQPIPGLGISLARVVRAPFHPQWSCSSKEYRYRLLLGATAPNGWGRYSWIPVEHARLAGRTVRPDRLADILGEYVGTRDFAAFHANSSPVRARTIHQVALAELGEGLFEVRIRGDRFARYLARFLVGTAVAAAAEIIPREKLTAALEVGERIEGLRAPAQGLILWEVRYPTERDPFSAADRQAPPGLPNAPPFQGLLEPT